MDRVKGTGARNGVGKRYSKPVEKSIDSAFKRTKFSEAILRNRAKEEEEKRREEEEQKSLVEVMILFKKST